MEMVLLFQVKIILWMVVFWAIYRVFLSRETFYVFNRYFLLAGILLPLLLPLAQYKYDVVIDVPASSAHASSANLPNTEEPVSQWLISSIVIYGLGVLFLLMRNLLGLARIRQIVRRSKRKQTGSYQLIQSAENTASFSVFNYIILSGGAKISDVERRLIFEHELAHVQQKHWIDLLVGQLVCMVQWFNPLCWVLLRDIRQNHEYLADEAVLKSGNSVAVYKATLINQSLGVPAIALASSFAPSQPLSRIHMMTRPASSGLKKLGSALILPVFGVFVWAFAEPEYVLNETPRFDKPATSVVVPNKGDTQPEVVIKGARLAEKKSLDRKAKPKQEVTHKAAKPEPKVTIQSVTTGETLFRLPDSEEFEPKTANSVIKAKPVYVLDGVEVDEAAFRKLNSDDIEAISVYKDSKALEMFGEKGKQGAIFITTKKAAQ